MTRFSPQQQAVIDFVRDGEGSAFVEAVAGAGKTTTLIGALSETTGSVAFAAYNTKIVKEIKAKTQNMGFGNRVRIGTFHSFGYNAWRHIYPKVVLEDKVKEGRTIEHLMIPMHLQALVFKLVGLAKQQAAGLLWQVDDHANWFKIVDHFDLAYEIEDERWITQAIEYAIKALRFHYSIGKEVINFDDMIWLPVISGCRVWQNDFVFVDEAQDTNPARRALARKMLRRDGRAIFVGDRHQAIYGFTGADSDAIDQITKDFNCKTLPLTVTYRCPKTVVQKAREVVGHIEAHETAPDGNVSYLSFEEFSKIGMANADSFHPTEDAILCRNTKPLVSTAYALIKRGIACHVEGRDIGLGLIKLVNRFQSKTLPKLRDKLVAYAEKETEKLIAKGKETQAEALNDRVETLLVIMDDNTIVDVDQLRNKIMSLFLDSENEAKPTLTLCTVHKSKGREWKRVFLYGKEAYMPSKYARQAWQIEQEMNLIYVAYTRAMSELVMVQAAI